MQRSPRVVRCLTCAARPAGEDKGPSSSPTPNNDRDDGHTEEKGLTEADPGSAPTDPAVPMDVDVEADANGEAGPTTPPPPDTTQSEEGKPSATPVSLTVPLSDFGLLKVECMPRAEDYEEVLAVIVDDSMTIANVREKVRWPDFHFHHELFISCRGRKPRKVSHVHTTPG